MSWIDDQQDKFTKSFARNPGSWVFAVVVILAVYFNYQIGSKLTQVCETLVDLEEEHYLSKKFPYSKKSIELCEDRLADEY